MADAPKTFGTALSIAQIKLVHEEIVRGQKALAANLVKYALGQTPDTQTDVEGEDILRVFFNAMVDADNYVGAAALCWGPPLFHPELNSVRQVFEGAAEHPLMLSMGASSMGKCLAPETLVITYDGRRVRADSVKPGDLLMGDDSTPRTVLSTVKDRGKLYRVTPERGEPWVCNDAHILSLRCSTTKICGNSGRPSKLTSKGAVSDIPIKEYAALPPSRRNILKQFSVGFELPEVAVPVDPYIYGAWLGDGSTTHPILPSVRDGEKFIRDDYMRNSRRIRLALLAGLIDSDGWKEGKAYRFCSKFKALAEQVSFLARSCGFHSTCTLTPKAISSIGFIGDYWTVYISGLDIMAIPTKEKRVSEAPTCRNPANVGISVEPIGEGDYAGFVLDGNHRFLLGDCTVTHNTYNLVIFCYMDWLRDPEWTSVKLMSQSDKHLTDNVWPHLMQIHEACALRPAGKVKDLPSDLWMGMADCPKSYGFAGMAFKQSQLSSGAWKGFKPQPKRPITDKNFAQFGAMTRLRVLMDEAQQIPEGVWQDLNSVKASVGEGRVKIFAAFNPEDVSQPVVRRAEPPGGWHTEQQETLYNYESAEGWWVVRLDAAKCENVVQRKEIYPGVMRYEAFLDTLKGGGDVSPRYWTFARGFPPLQNSQNTVIPPDWASTQRGEAIYIGHVDNVASVDLAYQGADKACLCIGRWGLAHGWRDQNGKVHHFVNRLNPGEKQPRHVLTIDQFFTMPKSLDINGVTQQVMGQCKMLRIGPEWVAMDSTGNGAATYSHAAKYWGKVLGINWAEAATESKVLSDDLMPASERFDGIPSEMWFAAKHWLDPNVCALLFNSTIQAKDLYSQMTTRRYKRTRNGRMHIESKDEFKSRNAGKSPDEMDAVVMLVHLIRMRGGIIPGIVEQTNRNKRKGDIDPAHSPTTARADVEEPLDTDGPPLDMGGDDVRGGLDFGED